MAVLTDKVRPGVIFDLDGTLADTLADIADALNVTLRSVGLEPLSTARVRPLVGEGLPVLLGRASGVTDASALADLIERFRAYYGVHLLDRTRLYPGIGPMLDRLTGEGCLLGVLSNKPHDSTQAICRHLLGAWSFREFIGATDGVPRKPDPTSALLLARSLDRRPEEIVVVGDSGVDVTTALRAGMRPIGVTWGFRDEDELRRAGAILLAHRPDELPDLVLG